LFITFFMHGIYEFYRCFPVGGLASQA
jgi:hypothetical protein